MTVRKRMLPPGWYPASAREVEEEIEVWKKESPEPAGKKGLAGILPHAGWSFSGRLAWRVLSGLEQVRTLVVLGGHLPARDSLRIPECDGFETPHGILETDSMLESRIKKEFSFLPDLSPDNTVEIQLPLIKYLFPRAKVFCLRVPPSPKAEGVGRFLGRLTREEGVSLAVIGSTDLTHYGPNYYFSPRGNGREAVEWVRKVNDAAFLAAVREKDIGRIIETGERDKAACSAGAAACAAAYAAELGLEGELLEHTLSYDRHPSSSFVGYGAVLFSRG